MSWANDSINCALAGAEIPNHIRYGLQDGTKVIIFEEASIEWIENALADLKRFHIPYDRYTDTKLELQAELKRRKEVQ